jgi:hypothetical protein
MNGQFQIVSAALFSEELVTRIPFRYGIATMTRLPHVFLQVEVAGRKGQSRGLAADHLPPKWFTKDPNAAVEDEIATMRAVIVHAASLAQRISFDRVFDFWMDLWAAQDSWAKANGYPQLLAHFGTSLVERAVIDAYCRLEGITFSTAVIDNRFGIDLRRIDSSLPGDWYRLLPPEPLAEIVARHTVGLADEITNSDLEKSGHGISDGLPRSLEDAVRVYGLREFKIKFFGQWERDMERLPRIFGCLEANAPADWRFSLDGNETFADAESFRSYWTRLSALPWLRPHLGRLLFMEQPLSRVTALESSADWHTWGEAPPVIIDESDGGLGDVPLALALGYSGSSHKNCKGVFKGILNRCRLTVAGATPGKNVLMSGEDLCNIGPVAMPQDLAVQSVLGNRSVERNGHHYFRGLSMWPEALQEAVVRAHPDLYGNERGFCALKITNGRLRLDSTLRAPFGYGAKFDPGSFCSSKEEIGPALPA